MTAKNLSAAVRTEPLFSFWSSFKHKIVVCSQLATKVLEFFQKAKTGMNIF